MMKASKTIAFLVQVLFVIVFTGNSTRLLAQQTKADVVSVVDSFFFALEKSDSASFSSLFVPGAVNYYVQQKGDSIKVGTQSPFGAVFNKSRIIKERFRPATMDIQMANNIAMVWGRYDLWVNEVFSHCGTDVFTLIKTPGGWKIATLSFSMEKEGCEQ